MARHIITATAGIYRQMPAKKTFKPYKYRIFKQKALPLTLRLTY